MVPVGSSVMLELVLAVHSYHVIAYLVDQKVLLLSYHHMLTKNILTSKNTLYQKRYITCYTNIILVYLDYSMTYLYQSLFFLLQNLDGSIIYKNASCVHNTSAFAMKFRKNI